MRLHPPGSSLLLNVHCPRWHSCPDITRHWSFYPLCYFCYFHPSQRPQGRFLSHLQAREAFLSGAVHPLHPRNLRVQVWPRQSPASLPSDFGWMKWEGRWKMHLSALKFCMNILDLTFISWRDKRPPGVGERLGFKTESLGWSLGSATF